MTSLNCKSTTVSVWTLFVQNKLSQLGFLMFCFFKGGNKYDRGSILWDLDQLKINHLEWIFSIQPKTTQ